MLRSSFIGLLALTSLVAVAGVDACSAPAAKSADAVAIDLTNAVCSVGEQQPIGQPWVDVVCVIAQGAEQGISIATSSAAASSDAGAPLASTSIASTRVIHLHLTKDQAATILGLHPVAAPAASK
jgi:hypothetical protein